MTPLDRALLVAVLVAAACLIAAVHTLCVGLSEGEPWAQDVVDWWRAR